MVEGIGKFRARMAKAGGIISAEVAVAMERAADDLVKAMRSVNPLPADILVDWTWGKPPKGAISVGKVAGGEDDKAAITIYSRGDTFAAHWFEFGTAERFHKSGKSVGSIKAQPFFFPVYRANKASIKRRMSAAVTRAAKKV